MRFTNWLPIPVYVSLAKEAIVTTAPQQAPAAYMSASEIDIKYANRSSSMFQRDAGVCLGGPRI
jgi:hypothetical protein